jgi:hypothetical protein
MVLIRFEEAVMFHGLGLTARWITEHRANWWSIDNKAERIKNPNFNPSNNHHGTMSYLKKEQRLRALLFTQIVRALGMRLLGFLN